MRTKLWLLSLLPIAALLLVLPALATKNDRLQPAAGTGFFVASEQSIGSSTSTDVALGDLDGDGDLDAFVANGNRSNGEANQVWFNQVPIFVPSEQALGSAYSLGVALGDLDGDGDLDAFVANEGPNKVWINQGGAQPGPEGIFLDSGQMLGTAGSQAVALGDLDNDLDLDATVANESGTSEQIWWNDGSGGFSAGPTLGDRHATDVAVGHLNGDNQLDVVFGDGLFGAENQIYWNDWISNTTFVAGPTFDAGSIVAGVALAHLDDNGALDIALATEGDNAIWWNNGDGTLSPGAAPSALRASDIALGPLDADQDVDAFVSRTSDGNLVWFNEGAKNLSDSGQNLGNFFSLAVALGDLDEDGDLDAFVANSGPNKVWLNGGTSEPPPAAQFRFVDGLQMIGKADSLATALGDLDGDGDQDAFLADGQAAAGAYNEVWLNQGGFQGGQPGEFQNSGQELGDASSQDVALGDLDGDLDLDAFVVNWSGTAHEGGGRVWLNNGSAVFIDGGQSTGQNRSQAVALGDLNGDNDLDAVVVNFDQPHHVYANLGDVDFFGTGQELGDSSNKGHAVALADLNGDAYLDIFIADESGSQVWLNDGQKAIPSFTANGQALPGSTAVALGRLNRDSYPDAFIGTTVLFNNGDGTFNESGQVLEANAADVALGDLDGDRDLDAFVVRDGQPDRAWANSGDGVFVDGGVMLAEDEGQDVSLADVDGDGDLDALVSNFAAHNQLWLNYSCAVELLSLPEETLSALPEFLGAPLNALRTAALDLNVYYRLRDELLGQTGSGRRYTTLFYRHNPEIFSLLIADSTLRAEARSVLELWQPNLQALLDGQGDTAVITASQVQAVEEFLQNLSAAGSQRLQEVIARERSLLPPPADFVGLTMAEAGDIVLHDNFVYLPALTRSQ